MPEQFFIERDPRVENGREAAEFQGENPEDKKEREQPDVAGPETTVKNFSEMGREELETVYDQARHELGAAQAVYEEIQDAIEGQEVNLDEVGGHELPPWISPSELIGEVRKALHTLVKGPKYPDIYAVAQEKPEVAEFLSRASQAAKGFLTAEKILASKFGFQPPQALSLDAVLEQRSRIRESDGEKEKTDEKFKDEKFKKELESKKRLLQEITDEIEASGDSEYRHKLRVRAKELKEQIADYLKRKTQAPSGGIARTRYTEEEQVAMKEYRFKEFAKESAGWAEQLQIREKIGKIKL